MKSGPLFVFQQEENGQNRCGLLLVSFIPKGGVNKGKGKVNN